VIHVRAGETRAVLAADGVTGFNDLTADPDGRVLVGGLRYNPLAGEDPVPGEVWVIDPGRGAARPFVGVDWPNGIGISPDGATVYVSDYAHARVFAYHRAGGEPHSFLTVPAGSADGLAVDEAGGVLVAMGAAGGIARFEPDGALDRVIDVPATFVTSVSFGGDDLGDLYITTGDNTDDPARAGTLFRERSDVPGLPVARASV
jgi:gluconolactonase